MFSYEYVGNIHIHSLHSDGTKNSAEIAKIAGKAGLDFICINDHDYMKRSFNLDEEGFYGNVAVLTGLEIGKDSHHYLAFDIKEMIGSNNLGPQEVINQVGSQGGFGFLAHPFEKGMPFKEKSIAYTWNDLTVSGFTGICIWNFSSRWKEQVKTLFHGIYYLLFKSQTLKGPGRRTISLWDELCQHRRVVGIGGSDAHGSFFRWGVISLKPLSYDFLLRSINVHVFLNRKIYKDFNQSKKDIYESIRQGRLFIAHDNLCSAKGFKFFFVSDDGSDLMMGEEDIFQPGNLVVELPAEGSIRILRNGLPVDEYKGMELVYPVIKRGVYRVEVYRKIPVFGWRPWIFSNPIYLR